MRPNKIVIAITVGCLLQFSFGCFSQTSSGTLPQAAAQSNPAMRKRPEPTLPAQTPGRSEGIVGTAGTAIGDIVLFPFRAITQAFTPPG